MLFHSLLFALCSFSILMLSLAHFSVEMGQIFFLMTQHFGVYFFASIALLLCGFGASVYNAVRVFASGLPALYGLVILLVLAIFLALIFSEFFILLHASNEILGLSDALDASKIPPKTPYQSALDYGFYALFVALPALLFFTQKSFDKRFILGRILSLTQPRFMAVICTLAGFCVAAFFDASSQGRADFALLLLGFAFVGYYAYKSRLNPFDFFSVVLLVLLFVTVLLGDFPLVNAESYFEVRRAFYALALFGWSFEWMSKLKPKLKEQ